MPDFDIDFCQDRRDEVIRYVQKQVRRRPRGADHHARQAAGARRAARRRPRAADALRAGRQAVQARPQQSRQSRDAARRPSTSEPKLQEARDSEPVVARLLEIAQKLEGLYRHASTHAAGMVIGDRPLDELVPLYRDPKSSFPITQFNWKLVEAAGLVKFDFLGLKTLTVLQKAVELDQARPRHRYRSARAAARRPQEPSSCWPRPIRSACSSSKARACARASSGSSPTASRTSSPWWRSTGRAPWTTSRPTSTASTARSRSTACIRMLEPILKETYGVIIYQEQVMQIAQVMAGYSLGEADLLRRAMGKKDKAIMAQAEGRVRRPARVKKRRQARRRRLHLRAGRQVRRLRLQQEPRRRLCARELPHRLSQGQLPRGVPGRLHDARHGQHRQARHVHGGSARSPASPSCRPASTRPRWISSPATRPSATRWPRSRTSARRRSKASSPSARANGAVQGPVRFRRPLQHQGAQQARPGDAEPPPAPSTRSSPTARWCTATSSRCWRSPTAWP